MSDSSISLYFGLKDGENADLEVVAAAATQWVEALRVAARQVDPNVQLRVELIDASEGSLRLNTAFEWVEEQLDKVARGTADYPRLRNLAIAFAIFLVFDAGPTYDYYFGDDEVIELSEEDRQRLDDFLDAIEKSPELEAPRRKFYKSLEGDPSITEVGFSEASDSKLLIKVPSTEFAQRGGLWAVVEDEQERTVSSVIDVVLVSPVLIAEPRSWKFKPLDGLPQFKAVMRDQHFLDALEQSDVRERLRTSIPMTVRLEVKEQKVGNAWVTKKRGRSIVEVISPKVD